MIKEWEIIKKLIVCYSFVKLFYYYSLE